MAAAGTHPHQPTTSHYSTNTGKKGGATEMEVEGDVAHIIGSTFPWHNHHHHRFHRKQHPTTWIHPMQREAGTT